jgi:hypothetical protein
MWCGRNRCGRHDRAVCACYDSSGDYRPRAAVVPGDQVGGCWLSGIAGCPGNRLGCPGTLPAERTTSGRPGRGERTSSRRLVARSAVQLYPKVLVFYLAVLPQFLVPGAGLGSSFLMAWSVPAIGFPYQLVLVKGDALCAGHADAPSHTACPRRRHRHRPAGFRGHPGCRWQLRGVHTKAPVRSSRG